MSRSGQMTALSIAVMMTALFQSSTSASHSWGNYHWARTSNPFTVTLGDNLASSWDSYLLVASSDWSQSTVLNTQVDAGQAKSKNCRPPSGRVEVCNGSYGNNGWLGVAQIWVSGSHITAGAVKLNDYYFGLPRYNTPAWRQYVMCQEVGHAFGLDHQDEDFNNASLGTCMDYTNEAEISQHPNAHDYDQLKTIYSHLDSTTTIARAQAGAGLDVDSPSEWGRLMKSSRGGRLQVFEREFGNGQRIVTFVFWA
jgi:hypothetical protein